MPTTLRRIAIAATLLLAASVARAQDREPSQTGFLFGGSLFSISNFDAQLPSSATGLNDLRSRPYAHTLYGGYARFSITKTLWIEPEILFYAKGAINEERQPATAGSIKQSASVILSYVELPILMRFVLPAMAGDWHPFVLVGPSGGWQNQCKYRAKLLDFDGYASCGGRLSNGEFVGNRYARWEVSAIGAAGAAGHIGKNLYSLQFRYSQGLTNAVRSGVGATQHNRGMSALLGLELPWP